MTEDEVVAEFQRRRYRANTRGWPAFILGFIAFGVGGKASNTSANPFVLVGIFGGMLLMIYGLLTVTNNMRCPLCNALPMTSGYRGRMLVADPDTCPNCGARLK
jgi:hypothetical protein